MANPTTDKQKAALEAPSGETIPSVGVWVFKGYFDSSGRTIRTSALPFPCRVGRSAGLDVTLPFPSVSSTHAEIYERGGSLFLRDLGSTNGTFVNRERVTQPVVVKDGDVIHFGEHEMRLARSTTPAMGGTIQLNLSQTSLPNSLPIGIGKLNELLRNRHIEPHFQPIIDLGTGEVRGYEVLGRGAHPELPVAPYELFRMAEEVRLEAELSRIFRDRGVEVGQGFDASATFYVNTHPTELREADDLFRSLTELRERHLETPIVLEVHESAVLSSEELKVLHRTLKELNMQLAYDDFGAGRSRVAELLEFPPEVVKFDMSIVRDLHLAKPSKLKMIGSLVSMLVQEQVVCLAEGVESELEANACRDLGFQLAQGYLFGRPAPLL